MDGFGKVDYPLFGAIVCFTCMPGLEGGCLGAVVGAMGTGSVVGEGVEAMGVAGNA